MLDGLRDHPKVSLLAEILGICQAQAVGHLEFLWNFVKRRATNGAVGAYDNRYIAEQAGWYGNPEQFVKALLEAKPGPNKHGWLEEDPVHRLIIHDWPDHCEDSVHKRLARQRTWFADGTKPKLTRLSREEREELSTYYAENDPPAVRPPRAPTTCAHPVRPATPSHSQSPAIANSHTAHPTCAHPERPNRHHKDTKGSKGNDLYTHLLSRHYPEKASSTVWQTAPLRDLPPLQAALTLARCRQARWNSPTNIPPDLLADSPPAEDWYDHRHALCPHCGETKWDHDPYDINTRHCWICGGDIQYQPEEEYDGTTYSDREEGDRSQEDDRGQGPGRVKASAGGVL